MKRLKLFVIMYLFPAILFAEYNEPLNLYEFIGLSMNSGIVNTYIKNLGEYKSSNFGNTYKDYHYENAGIQFRTTLSGEIVVIFCFNENNRLINKPVRFSGELPFNLTFDDSLEKIQNKIGESTLVNSYGFYGRVYQWTVQDSLTVSMEVKLPRNESEKLFIDFISLSKNK